METKKLFLLFLTLTLQLSLILANTRLPLVAIVSIPVLNNSTNYTEATVGASYVRWLEASGADSVVIHPWQTDEEHADVLSLVNGVLLQGGEIENEEYTKSVSTIINLAISIADDKQDKIPIFGIGHGMEILFNVIADENLLSNKSLYNKSVPLIFNKELLKTSQLFDMLEDEDFEALGTKNVTFHLHKFGLEPKVYEENKKLNEFFRLTSTNIDENKNKFIASVEAIKYPIYAVQFNPDAISFNKNKNLEIDNSDESVRISRALGNAFVDLCKKSNTHIMPEDELQAHDYIIPYEHFPVERNGDYVYVYTKKSNPNPKF